MAFLQDVYPTLKYLFNICNGAGIAASVGLLNGHRVTTINKAAWSELNAFGRKTHWIAQAR